MGVGQQAEGGLICGLLVTHRRLVDLGFPRKFLVKKELVIQNLNIGNREVLC